MKRLVLLCLVLIAAMPAFAQKFSKNCIPTYTNSCSDNYYISSVVTTGGLVNISNTSTCGSTSTNYSYYTGAGKTLEANAGSTISITIKTNSPSGGIINRVAFWFDWNRDDSFDNTNYSGPMFPDAELINTSPNSSATFVVNVPFFAKDGPGRLRIRCFSTKLTSPNPNTSNLPGGDINPCLTSTNIVSGETEDYDVIIHNPCNIIPAVSISNVTSKGADISWTVNGNERLVEYMIDQSPNDPGNGNFLLKKTQNAIQVPDTNTRHINCNTKYYFHVRGVCDTDSHSQATWSYGPWRLDSFQTPPCCDVPPITVDNITSNTAIASWGPVTSVIQYEYAVSISDSPEPTGGTRYNGTTTLLPGLDCSREYYFFLRALCSPTPTSDWGIDSFLTQPCTSIDNSPVLPEFKLNAYPNPTRNVVTLSVMHGIKREVGAIEVMDVTGKVLKTAVMDGDKLDLNLNDVPSGLYMIRYSDEQRTQVIKVRRE